MGLGVGHGYSPVKTLGAKEAGAELAFGGYNKVFGHPDRIDDTLAMVSSSVGGAVVAVPALASAVTANGSFNTKDKGIDLSAFVHNNALMS